jgi:hypothetical protein
VDLGAPRHLRLLLLLLLLRVLLLLLLLLFPQLPLLLLLLLLLLADTRSVRSGNAPTHTPRPRVQTTRCCLARMTKGRTDTSHACLIVQRAWRSSSVPARTAGTSSLSWPC